MQFCRINHTDIFNLHAKEASMGQKDKVEKLLEDYPDVFADIINVLIYDGKQVIKPQELSETKVRSQYKAADDSLHEQERDILKVWEKRKDYKIIFGIENQTSTDKTMSFRVMAYDGASYRSQLLSDEDKKELCKVQTLVLYFGDKPWNVSRSLKDTFKKKSNISDELNNYKIDVFEIAYLTENQIEMFQSDFGIIADYFVKRRKGYKIIENHKPIKHVDEMLKFMRIFAEDERFLQLDVKKDEKGEVTMCTILDNAINTGIERGIIQGENLKLIMQVQKKMKKGDSVSKIADDLLEDEITILPIYNLAKEYPEDTERDIYQRLN